MATEAPAMEVRRLTNERAKLRLAEDVRGADGILQERARWERCEFCVFFNEPNYCTIVEGPVAIEQTCDWIQPDPKAYEKGDYLNVIESPEQFAWGLIKNTRNRSRVIDVAETPRGWLLLLEDEADPPHRFSLKLRDINEALSWINHWTQQEVDRLQREGKKLGFKPPSNFEEAEDLFGRGLISIDEFRPFRVARQAEKLAKRP